MEPGTYYIGGIADYNNAVAESNQIGHNHDVTQITVTAPPLPDLTAAFDHVSNTTIAAGGSTSVDFWVVNFGNAAAAASTSGLYLSTTPTITTADTLLTTVASPALTANGTAGYYDHQTVSLALPGNLAPGTYYIGGIADYNNAVAESNQIGHNHDVTQITVTGPPLPDLTAAFDHVSNTTIAAGGSTSVDFWVVNFGNAAAAASTSGLYLSTDAHDHHRRHAAHHGCVTGTDGRWHRRAITTTRPSHWRCPAVWRPAPTTSVASPTTTMPLPRATRSATTTTSRRSPCPAPGSVSPAAALTNATSTSAFDMLIGGARNDTFVFAVNSGNDTITTNSRGLNPMQFDHVAAIARDPVHFTTADANALVPYEAAADMLQHHFNDFFIV